MFPIIQIGPMALQAPGLILLIGLWLGLILAERLAPRFRANANHVYNIVFVALVAGVIGARVSFVLENHEVFFQNPLNIFSLNPGLLDPIGGAVIGLLAALVYGNRKKIIWWSTLDAIAPFLGVMIIALGFSNLAFDLVDQDVDGRQRLRIVDRGLGRDRPGAEIGVGDEEQFLTGQGETHLIDFRAEFSQAVHFFVDILFLLIGHRCVSAGNLKGHQV